MIPETNSKVYPLSVLCQTMTCGPPSLGAILILFEGTEHVVAFWKLVDEYLPDKRLTILESGPDRYMETFADFFSDRYFPIDGRGVEEMESFLYQIPVILMGMGYRAYHEFQNLKEPYVMMLGLITDPFVQKEGEGCHSSWGGYTDIGSRVAILDYLAAPELLGPELAGRIPAKGWEPKSLHLAFDGTKYQGLAGFADVVHSSTEYTILNVDSDEEIDYPQWDRGEVDNLTEEWAGASKVIDEYQKLAEWLEDAPQERFEEMLDFLLKTGVAPEPEKKSEAGLTVNEILALRESGKTLVEVFNEERGDNGTDN